MRISRAVAVLSFAMLVFTSVAAVAEDRAQMLVKRDVFKRLRTREQLNLPPDAPPPNPQQSWTLTKDATTNSPGTFGFDISHWDTEGCTFTWQTLVDLGVRFVYDEVTRGAAVTDPSVVTAWNDLEQWHTTKRLFRGAYHFLMPNSDGGTDASAQADAFLTAVGAVNGKIPSELPPIVDIEPTKTTVTEGSAQFNACKAAGGDYLQQSGNTYSCNEWYSYIVPNKRQNIVALAQDFAARVKLRTNQDVMVYSSSGPWSSIMGDNPSVFQPLLKGRAIWTAAYTPKGDNQMPEGWGSDLWNLQWNLPVMFGGASYPPWPNFNVPDFWQFAQYGMMQQNPSSCGELQGNMDLNYIRVRDAAFEAVFGIH